jgi:predicted PurR-regulated permease PerM
MQSPTPNGNAQRVELDVPVRTLLKLLVTAVAVWALLKLWPEVLFLFIALILAVALDPLVQWLGRHHISRGWSIASITVFALALVAAFVGLIVPPMGSQVMTLLQDLPSLLKKVKQVLPRQNPVINNAIDQVLKVPSSPELKAQVSHVLIWGQSALSGLLTAAIVLVITIYLLLDGERLYAWLLAFVPRRHREKMSRTVDGVSEVVHAYVRGQAIACLLFATFVAAVLSLFHIPSALALAVLAALCDVIPVAGIFIATLPAVLVALTVSPATAIGVGALYITYHLFEAYVLLPRLYGKVLRLSTLTVLLALIVGAALQGIVGAVLALPIVAAYPIVERIWLTRYFADEVIEDHQALDRERPEKHGGAAVEHVLHGQHPPGAGNVEH